MGKKKSKSKKEIICDICKTRTGGQIALAGFTYQFLYSCFLILSEMDEKTIFILEGVEDIDKVYVENSIENSKHIQLKYSIQKQDATFMKDILKNFLEVYLIDKDRGFKLVYDFQVAKGNLDKLLRGKLDDKSNEYWKQKVNEIKKENPAWNWENFSFEHFISKLSFEKIRKIDLAKQIEGLLIKRYDILTDNLSLYANGLKVCCFEKMTRGDSVNKNELDELILEIKTDISKGNHNPAYKWIKKVDFDIEKNYEENFDYYEGKKPSYQDIAMKLPVDREIIEKEIKDSIIKNRITVIKASSGQGKTTLAFKTAYELRNEYTIYQLLWCKDSKELDNIVSYIKSRVKMGEKPLIILDNLDSDFVEWNKLVQILQNKILINYKMIITTREDDWYNYGGDLSNIKSLKVIKPILSEDEAKEIYTKLRKQGNLHFSIRDWRKEFRKVEKKKLLIEYIYLLTHGEMLSERISNQIREISKSESGKIKCEILRKICFADMCGIQISVKKLIKNLKESSFQDYGEILKSLENEYLVKIDGTEKYIEGLHPVRSQHIVCQLHEFIDLEDTILELVNIIDLRYFAKLFFYLPKYVKNKQEFYQELVGKIFNKNDLRCCIDALRGVFSGVIMEYYIANKAAYDEANSRGGLELYSMELNPFIKFKQENLSVGVLDELREAMPDMRNIDYLCRLRDKTPKIELSQSDIYILCKSIYGILKKYEVFTDITDIISYQKIMYWLINVNSTFNLTDKISLDILWKNREKYLVETISNIMYIYFYENRIEYDKFVTENMEMILIYLRNITKSMRIYTDLENKKVYVEYILMPSEIDKGNKESVLRLNIVCKMLPFFDVYCAKSIKPKIDIFSEYEIPDDSYKTIPRRNLIIGFHKEFISLWNNTVLSNYEFDSIYEWIEFWLNVREDIVEYLKKSNSFLCKKLGKKILLVLQMK